MTGWDDPLTAAQYDAFTREHALYHETSRDLVRLAQIERATLVVDLACGTGVTTAAVLEQAGPDTSVLALDKSPAMIEIARSRVTDPRVQWICAPAVELDSFARDADAIVCNSAIWQLEMTPAIAAAGRALRTGGRLVFDLARPMLTLPMAPAESRRHKPTLTQLMHAVAVLEYDYVPPHRPSRLGFPLTFEALGEMLRAARLEAADPVAFEYDTPPAAQLAWLRVPIFANNVLLGLSYDTQMAALDQAYARWDKASGRENRWVAFVATKSP